MYNTSQTVSSVKQQHKQIQADMGKIGNTATVVGVLGLKFSVIGVIATVTVRQ
jgi:hypothetical protein